MNNQEYIEKWLAGTLTEEEKALFSQTPQFKDLQRLDRALARFKPAEPDWNASFENIRSRKKEAKVVSFNWMPILKVAAVLIVGASALFYLSDRILSQPTEVAYTTGAGETREVTLPDQSVVRLNAKSTIAFSEDTWEEERTVKLDGEAFFMVKKGEKFQVTTSGETVTVLGTQFTVKDRGDFYEVICYEGKVQVVGNSAPVQLTAKQSYREIASQVTGSSTTMEDGPSWLNQESSFESVPFREVLDELARQYDVKIRTEGVDMEQLYTGRFPHSDLTTALKSVTMPFGLTYQIKDKDIMVIHAQ